MTIGTLLDLEPSFCDRSSKVDVYSFLNTHISDLVTPEEMLANLPSEESLPFKFAVLIKRLKYAQQFNPEARYNLPALLMITYLAPNVGSVVTHAYTLYRATIDHGPLLAKQYADLFIHGFPTEEGYHAFWRKQKGYDGAMDNWLDHDRAWLK